MSSALRSLRIALGALLALLLAVVGIGYAMSERILRERHEISAPSFATRLPTDSASLAEGERLARTRGCFGCHGEHLEGAMFFSAPHVADLPAPNLTAVAARYTDAELERAIRHGVRPDGTALFTMPAEMYRSLSDEDLARLIAWLRTQPTREGESRPRWIGPLGRAGLVLGDLRSSRHWIETEGVLPRPADPALTLGHYVAATACTECHGSELRGDGESTPSLVAIAPAYTAAEFGEFFRTGRAKGGRELAMMSGVARRRLAYLRVEEVEGLHAYLLSLAAGSPTPPVAR